MARFHEKLQLDFTYVCGSLGSVLGFYFDFASPCPLQRNSLAKYIQLSRNTVAILTSQQGCRPASFTRKAAFQRLWRNPHFAFYKFSGWFLITKVFFWGGRSCSPCWLRIHKCPAPASPVWRLQMRCVSMYPTCLGCESTSSGQLYLSNPPLC